MHALINSGYPPTAIIRLRKRYASDLSEKTKIGKVFSCDIDINCNKVILYGLWIVTLKF